MLAVAIVFLILLGIALIVAEFFILPGTFIPGIIGFLLMCFGIVLSYRLFGSETGNIFLLASMGTFILIMFLALRSKTWKRLPTVNETSDSADSADRADAMTIKAGDQGLTITRIDPTGKVRISDHIVEATTTGDYIEADTEVKVTEVKELTVIVKPLEQ